MTFKQEWLQYVAELRDLEESIDHTLTFDIPSCLDLHEDVKTCTYCQGQRQLKEVREEIRIATALLGKKV